MSTTASKAVCIDGEGSVLGQFATAHTLSSPRPLWREQVPEDWWRAMCNSIQGVLALPSVDAKAVQAIGLTGQMHGLVILDADGQVLRPAMLWNDGRAGAQCEAIRAQIGLERLVAITGNDAFTGFTAPKLLWVRDHEPEYLRKDRTGFIAKGLHPLAAERWICC